MKTFIIILLFGLLGFLGCSGSNDGATNVIQAIPVAPFGITATMTPTYEWTPVPLATKYCLMVHDTNGTPMIEEWYTADEAGCASDNGLCNVTSDIEVTGNTWKVMACAGMECGAWSESTNFYYALQWTQSDRFIDNGETVWDTKIKKSWTKVAMTGKNIPWYWAENYCENLRWEGQGDHRWRLPHLHELRSLLCEGTTPYGPQTNACKDSNGHKLNQPNLVQRPNPFIGIAADRYWTTDKVTIVACEGSSNCDGMYTFSFYDGTSLIFEINPIHLGDPSQKACYWCISEWDQGDGCNYDEHIVCE